MTEDVLFCIPLVNVDRKDDEDDNDVFVVLVSEDDEVVVTTARDGVVVDDDDDDMIDERFCVCLPNRRNHSRCSLSLSLFSSMHTNKQTLVVVFNYDSTSNDFLSF